jgi:hypothetical protein
MATFKINNGDSITFAFTLTGVEAADILNLEFAIGNLSYTLANGKLIQSENDPLLFYIYMLSKDTFCLNGNYPISVAINTAELGVLKKNLVGNLAVVKTNTKMNLPVETQIITATYNFTVNPNGIIVDEFLATIAKGEPGISAYEVAVENGFIGTETEWLESLKSITDLVTSGFGEDIEYDAETQTLTIDKYNWMDLARGYKEIPTLHSTTSTGTIYQYIYQTMTLYRYIATDLSEDAFYNNSTLTTKLCEKKISL